MADINTAIVVKLNGVDFIQSELNVLDSPIFMRFYDIARDIDPNRRDKYLVFFYNVADAAQRLLLLAAWANHEIEWILVDTCPSHGVFSEIASVFAE